MLSVQEVVLRSLISHFLIFLLILLISYYHRVSFILSEFFSHLKLLKLYFYSSNQGPTIQDTQMEQVIDILKDYEAEAFASLEAKNTFLIEKKPGVAEPTLHRNSIIQGTISSQVTDQKFEAIIGELKELDIKTDISQTLKSGARFQNYTDLDNLLDEGKTELKHIPGEVLLVQLWATWCTHCHKPIQNIHEMLIKNEVDWAGKVRIVGVNMNEDKETANEIIEDKGWNKMQHLTLLGWDENNKLLKDLQVIKIPFICLVDKFGKIYFTGHPNSIQIEKCINQLLLQEEPISLLTPLPAAPTNQNDWEIIKTLLTVQNIKNTFGESEFICCDGRIITTFDQGKLSRRVSVEIFVYEHDKATLEKVREVFGGLSGVDVKVREVKTVEVPCPEHPKCWECGVALVFPYYWLYWEQGTHFGCVACVEKASAVPGHHYHYEKNSVLLADKWERVSLKHLGQNLQPQKIEQIKVGHPFSCNCCVDCNCNSGPGLPRYICIECRSFSSIKDDYVDICMACKEKVVKGDETIMEKLANVQHLKAHPLIRVLYNVGGYYQY